MIKLFNEDCIAGARKHLSDESIDLMICDPPFGIGEGRFRNQYNRSDQNVLSGYVEAPSDYATWTLEWMTEAKRVLKPNGSMYLVSGYTNLVHLLNAAQSLELFTINHIIWKYNFGVFTKRKFVSSHYHVLYLKKSSKAEITFNRACRFQDDERDEDGRSMRYRDLEDVWTINRENRPGELKNVNKLPEALIEKMILYSSNAGDVVCDFFLGNFTSAVVAKRLERIPAGFELNSIAFDYHIRRSFPEAVCKCDG